MFFVKFAVLVCVFARTPETLFNTCLQEHSKINDCNLLKINYLKKYYL
jgi:hypothetical protein